MKVLVFQHIACEHPGSLRQFLARDGVAWDAVQLDQGDIIPPLDGYDALWVMGGPMDVWDTEENPWLIAEKQAIRTWVTGLKKPYLGLCLGHQLLADTLGGKCGLQVPPEIGVLDVALTDAGRQDPLFAGMQSVQKAVQWHSVQVTHPPEGATVLAASDICPVQAMRVGKHACSLQYHIEIEPDTITNWGQVPAYHEALISAFGPKGYTEMQQEAAENMNSFLTAAEKLYSNFMAQVRDGVSG